MGVFDSFSRKRLRSAVVCAVVATVVVCRLFVFAECIETKPPTMTHRSLDYDAEVRPNDDLSIAERIDVNPMSVEATMARSILGISCISATRSRMIPTALVCHNVPNRNIWGIG